MSQPSHRCTFVALLCTCCAAELCNDVQLSAWLCRYRQCCAGKLAGDFFGEPKREKILEMLLQLGTFTAEGDHRTLTEDEISEYR
jgi:hypothetical protein